VKRWYFLILLFIIPSGLGAQTNDSLLAMQWQKALLLQHNEAYYDAVTELQRLLFFDSEGKYTFQAQFVMGECYAAGARIHDAATAFNKALLAAPAIGERNTARREVFRMLLLGKQYGTAAIHLDLMEKNGFPPDEIRFWKGWLAIFQDDWEKAAGYFGSPDTTIFLRDFCLSVQKKKYNRNLAELLSVILPGAGQVYTGHYAQGLISLGWNGLFGYLTVKAFQANRVFDGVMTGSLLWLRFYAGGYQTAGTWADERNTEIYNDALRFLEREYKGKKP
jgi:TM2 domain-containing membrane protein YozV